MSSIAVSEALTALDTAVKAVDALDWDGLSARESLAALERLETAQRRQRAISHDIVAALCRRDQAEVGGLLGKTVADVLRISLAEARRRIRDAQQLTPRTTLTGETLPPELPATAQAWHAGVLDEQHLRAIQKFIRDLPDHVPPVEVEKAERFLAGHAANLRPDQLEKLADRVAITLNPDGKFSDDDRARRRGFLWCGAQRADGMSIGKLIATPALRAEIDAWLAKYAAPGMCNPDDHTPVTTGEPSAETAAKDARGHGQRQHDALSALLRGQLGDPKLGSHNGLPVTVIVSATLQQLQSAAGEAVTAGGTLLPIRDVMRMAGHSYHYLAIFDQHTERALYLGRSKRIASPDQRIVLHAKERGCTAPGCDIPGYWTEVHHTDEWADGGLTDIDKLTFGCTPDHRLIKPGGWRTRKQRDGRTQWIPPPHYPLPGGTNNYHHPERFFDE